MNDCLFCKIVSGEIPSKKVYEDDLSIAVLDIYPVNPGHVLVMPKKHSPDFVSMEDEDLARLFPVMKKVAQAALKTVGAAGFNLGANTGAISGQVIFHTHFHIMPRFEGDGLKLWAKKNVPPEEMERIAGEMAKILSVHNHKKS